MTAPVKKLGSKWEGQVVSLQGETLITNFTAAEVSSMGASAKVWVRLKGKKVKVQAGASGFLEISAPGSVGDVVTVEFLT